MRRFPALTLSYVAFTTFFALAGCGPGKEQGGSSTGASSGAGGSGPTGGTGGDATSGPGSGSGSGQTSGAGGGGGEGGWVDEICGDGGSGSGSGSGPGGCQCSPGDELPCYSGPPGTLGVGVCKGGRQECENGFFGECQGEIKPSEEVCNGDDDDCDGDTDEGFKTVTCGVGLCQTSVEECHKGKPKVCTPGQPKVEKCNGLDDDCDGDIDEGCSCVDGTTQPCYSGGKFTKGIGACKGGVQTCAGGQWGECEGDVTPSDEVCNGVDDDCDGDTDEDLGTVACGVGQCKKTLPACKGGKPTVCEPSAPAPEKCDGADNDCDGLVDEDNPGGGEACDTGLEGVCGQGVTACINDALVCKATAKPGAEVCNGADDDCDGLVDEDAPGTGEACDTGLDGVCGAGTTTCAAGKIVCAANAQGSPELCDGKDNDCDGAVDEGSPEAGQACNTGKLGACAIGTTTCEGGAVECVETVSPEAETCDAVDNDCDGVVDEKNPGGGSPCTTGMQGACGTGTTTCESGALVCKPNVEPGPEVCDGADNDCDGAVDDGNPGGGGKCSTGGVGVCASGTKACVNGSIACVPDAKPSAELCDGLDNDCNGAVDDGNPGAGAACATGKLGVCSIGTTTCVGGALACLQTVSPSSETCDGLDNDCDGAVDEGNPGGGAACDTGKVGVCKPGTITCSGGQLVCKPASAPSAEVCDGKDNDCDGQVDENAVQGVACNTGEPGLCSAGVTDCSSGVVVCKPKHSPSAEVCDGKDNDCDGAVDDGNPGAGVPCSTGKPGVCGEGTTTCEKGGIVCKPNVSPGPELCDDGIDNDCDGLVDEVC